MRTRLILATAVSLSMIGTGSYAVNHPGLISAVTHLGAQEAVQDAVAADAAPSETVDSEAVHDSSTDMEPSTDGADTTEATETPEMTDANAPAPEAASDEDHAHTTDAEAPAATPEG